VKVPDVVRVVARVAYESSVVWSAELSFVVALVVEEIAVDWAIVEGVAVMWIRVAAVAVEPPVTEQPKVMRLSEDSVT
jgi:hypothetical protein